MFCVQAKTIPLSHTGFLPVLLLASSLVRPQCFNTQDMASDYSAYPQYPLDELYFPEDYHVYSAFIHRSIRAIHLHFKHCQTPENSLFEKLYFTNHKHGNKCAALLYREAKLDKLWSMLVHYEPFRGEQFATMLPPLPRRADWTALMPDINKCPPDLAVQIRVMQNEIRIAINDNAHFTAKDVIRLQKRGKMLTRALSKLRARHTEGSSDEIECFEASSDELQDISSSLEETRSELKELMQLDRYVTHRKQQRLCMITFYLRLRAHLLDGPWPLYYALQQTTRQISKSYLDTGMPDYFRSSNIRVELEKCIIVLHQRAKRRQELDASKERENPRVLKGEPEKPVKTECVQEKAPSSENEEEKPTLQKNKPDMPSSLDSSPETLKTVESEKQKSRAVESEKEKPRAGKSKPQKPSSTPSQPLSSLVSYSTEAAHKEGESRPSNYEMMNLVQFARPRLQRGEPTLSFRRARRDFTEGRNN